MIKINKDNVEAFYLDHLEGNLNTEDTVMLMAFIDANPDMSDLFEDTEGLLEYTLEAQEVNFGDTDELKGFPCDEEEICLSNIDYWLISKTENTLSDTQIQLVDTFVKSNKLEDTEAYITAAYLKPNLTEVFTEKHILKKKSGTILPLLIRFSAVAAIFVFFWMVLNQNKTDDPIYSSRNLERIDIAIPNYEHPNLDVTNNETIINNDENFSNLASVVKKSGVSQQKKDGVNDTKILDKATKLTEFFSEPFTTIAASKNRNVPPKALAESFDISDIFSDFELALTAKPTNPNNNFDKDLFANNKTYQSDKSELKEYYKPVTKTLSNLTSLNMSYQKAPQSAEKHHTVIEIGNFSFERKRKK
ncbi:MAG: hypothetical protein AB8B74_00370 [Crocinitomicaceae bacterium]